MVALPSLFDDAAFDLLGNLMAGTKGSQIPSNFCSDIDEVVVAFILELGRTIPTKLVHASLALTATALLNSVDNPEDTLTFFGCAAIASVMGIKSTVRMWWLRSRCPSSKSCFGGFFGVFSCFVFET
ncbi:hypothetical protein PMIN05_010459 [Paraphaeosphaeria minitans]